LAAVISKQCQDVRVIAFGTKAKDLMFLESDGPFRIMATIAQQQLGGTNAYTGVDVLRSPLKDIDRIILLSDMQCYDTDRDGNNSKAFRDSIAALRKELGKKVWVHTINLQGTVQAQMASGDENVNLMSGYSEKLTELIAAVETPREQEAGKPMKTTTAVTIEYLREKYRLTKPETVAVADEPDDGGSDE
jgi:hypothetical protein